MTPVRWGDLLVAGDDRRREIRARDRHGIDGVEVGEDDRRLTVLFLEHVPEGLSRHNIRIDGQAGARPVHATSVRRSAGEDPELEDRLIVELDRPGSAGRYRLRIVEPGPDGRPGLEPHRGIDLRFAQAGFVFNVDAPLPAIARRPSAGPPPEEEISYLSRDYEGLRQLMLDRLAVTVPGFTERHVPDLWITLVELLAYIGDDLSYYEDAVATEAYLQTARQRISIRRHARLLGYRLHNGASARTWVCLSVARAINLPLAQVRFAAAGALADGTPLLDATALPAALLGETEQFTPLPAPLSPALPIGYSPSTPKSRGATVALHPAHNEIPLWSWGEANSRLIVGATSAVLVDGPSADTELALSPGDVVVLEETAQPEPPHDPGRLPVPGPPDPGHRHAVRLTAVRHLTDELYAQPLLEVQWGHEDALPFELPVTIAGQRACHALANIVLVSHGVEFREPITLDDTGAATLTQPGVSFSTPFPDPKLVGRHQARVLRGLYGAWRTRIERYRAAAAYGTPLSQRALAELREQLGEDELKELGIDDQAGDDDRAARQARGLAELLARADRLLARRRHRLETLAALAQASGPLERVLIDELTADWGAGLIAPLTPSTPGGWGPASAATVVDPPGALPIARLADGSGTWEPAVDLIGIGPTERAFVAEVDDEGFAHLRVNNASAGSTLQATYLLGNGVAGNVIAEAINGIVWVGEWQPDGATGNASGIGALSAVTAVRNPALATGGVQPEDTADARLAIPGSFQDRQPRALTAADYAQLAAALPGVRRAAAELRFTGALAVADVAVQPKLGEDPHPALLESVQAALAEVRRIGQVVRVHAPRYRPLLIELDVALRRSTIRATAAEKLMALLSDGWLADGRPALFNPQRLAFGQSVFASAVVAAAQNVDGVESVALERFSFVGEPEPLGSGTPPAALDVAGMEIVRLDNDPAHPENGYAVVSLEGGR